MEERPIVEEEVAEDTEGSLSSIGAYGVEESAEDYKESPKLKPVRESVKAWKVRELQKSTDEDRDPSDIKWLRQFVKASAVLFFDLKMYLDKSQNKEENLKDDLYVKIIGAIGSPTELSTTERYTMENVLNRDLVELPLTIDEDAIDERAESRLSLNGSALNEEEIVEEEVEDDADAEEQNA